MNFPLGLIQCNFQSFQCSIKTKESTNLEESAFLLDESSDELVKEEDDKSDVDALTDKLEEHSVGHVRQKHGGFESVGLDDAAGLVELGKDGGDTEQVDLQLKKAV